MDKKTCIVIVGPTAVGKTSLSLQLAKHFTTEIISADSRQCFKELNIGVAKPPDAALNSIKHYFINSHSIHDVVNAQVFEQYALNAVEEIFKENDLAIMVGGTGMYIKAFCEGLDEMPDIDSNVRNEVTNEYRKRGLNWLQNEVRTHDPEFWQVAERQNPQRLMRALEIVRATGKSVVNFQTRKKKERHFNLIKLGIEISKSQLHKNINERVDAMIKEGLIDEVRALTPYQHFNALRTVGYQEIFEYFDRKSSLIDAIDKIKSHTSQYAKRQITWFKKDNIIKWANRQDLSSIISSGILLA